MTRPPVPEPDFERYFAALTRADAAAAVGALDEALARGSSFERLIRDVLVPTQSQVGERWFSGEWSVADEHAATAVTEQALVVLGPPRRRSGAPEVALTCAEGEWHTLPARLAGELLRLRGLEVRFLGGSLPAADLSRYLQESPPDLLAVSVTVATNLLGVARLAAAAQQAGVPAVAGGAAMGQDDSRAQRLGVYWVADVAELPELIGAPPVTPRVDIPAEAWWLDAVPEEVLAAALASHEAAAPWVRAMTPWQRSRTLEDLRWLARHAGAAVACGDERILADLLGWVLELLRPRGVPDEVVVDGWHHLADQLEVEAPMGAALIRSVANQAGE